MMSKILINLLYYQRPNLVKNALRSIVNSSYSNWHLAFHDDGSLIPGKPIVDKIINKKVTFYNTNSSVEYKKNNGGSFIGKSINEAIKETDCDISIILCDDDELHKDYLNNLNIWFDNNDKLSCYSHVIVYNPLTEVSEKSFNVDYFTNKWTEPINCSCKVDASQVAWRVTCNKEYNVWFPYPCSKNHDSLFFNELYNRCGPSHYTGFISQYKGIHEKQLGVIGETQAWSSQSIDKSNNSFF